MQREDLQKSSNSAQLPPVPGNTCNQKEKTFHAVKTNPKVLTTIRQQGEQAKLQERTFLATFSKTGFILESALRNQKPVYRPLLFKPYSPRLRLLILLRLSTRKPAELKTPFHGAS